jgi:hypothetical protein
MEVKLFKKEYKVPFPLVADRNGGVKANFYYTETPYFVAIDLTDKNLPKVFYVNPGEFDDPEGFLDEILKSFGAKEGKK